MFLVIPEECENEGVVKPRFVWAEDEEDAKRRYRARVFPWDIEFLEYLADKTLNSGFADKFCEGAMGEIEEAIVSDGRTIFFRPEVFTENVMDAFGEDNAELAEAYVLYFLGEGDPDIKKLPRGFVEFVAGSDMAESWVGFRVIEADMIETIK